MTYKPPQEILEKYANVLINFALNSGEGLKKGEVVNIRVPKCAESMLLPLQKAVLEAGGHPVTSLSGGGVQKQFFEMASQEQIEFFMDKYYKGLIDQVDHMVMIIANDDPHELEHIDPKKLMLRRKSMKQYMDWRNAKEAQGKFTWTLGLFGTQAMAKEVNLNLEEYWDQIIKACYLDEEDPIAKWKEFTKELDRIKDKLNALPIDKVHVKSASTDLWVGLGEKRKWVGGSGRNIPSFEIFTSPDWRQTNGYIQFTEPLYRYGNLVENVYAEFKDGICTKITATKGEDLVREMIATKNANKIGEFSLTDSRFSKITKFMGETLYDENVGGRYGNTHIAFGSAYKDCFDLDPAKVTDEEWKELGLNESVVHTDIISTEDRVVTAHLKDGSQVVIYEDGKFTV